MSNYLVWSIDFALIAIALVLALFLPRLIVWDYQENTNCQGCLYWTGECKLPKGLDCPEIKEGKKMKEYKCEYYSVQAAENSCFFCQHCTDIFFDYANGPYMFICDEDADTTKGYDGQCNLFKEEQK